MVVSKNVPNHQGLERRAADVNRKTYAWNWMPLYLKMNRACVTMSPTNSSPAWPA